MKQQIGLGKGLGEILSGVPNADQLRKPVGYVNKMVEPYSSAKPEGADVLRVPMDSIEPNPFQPRLFFDQAALDELASSIKALGLIQPITVRRMPDGRFQIISGERRFRACRMAGMSAIPAYVREADDQGMLEMAIVENLQRSNLDPIELAMSYQRLLDECSLTQEQLAERVSKGRATVANTLRLLNLPAKVQHDLKVGLVSVGHAKVLLGVEDAQIQEQLCDLIVRDGLSVRQLEDLVRDYQPEAPKQPKKKDTANGLPEEFDSLKSCMAKYFAKGVSVRRSDSGKGTLTIHFSSDDELRSFIEALDRQ